MKMLSKLMFIALIYVGCIFSTPFATEVFEKRNDTVWPSQFDPRFSREYIKEEKEVSRRQGIEKGIEKSIEKGVEIGIEKGRIEESRSIALQMLADGEGEDKIVKYTKLTKLQIQELKESLDQ